MNTMIFIQQRMGSSRLPGKAQALIGSKTLTKHVVDRAAAVVGADNVMLAVPMKDDFGWAEDYPCHLYYSSRPEADLLGRMADAARAWETRNRESLDIIVRLTGDNPFVPESLIQSAINAVWDGEGHAVESRSDPSNRPNGIDVQAMRAWAAYHIESRCDNMRWREHITPALHHFVTTTTLSASGGRKLDDIPYFSVTVDTSEDLARVRAIAQYVSHPNLEDLISLRTTRPELFA